MTNQSNKKDQMPHITNWQIAYAARELRHNKSVTLSCLSAEKDIVFEQLSSFSNSKPIMMKSVNKPNSSEVFLQIAESV